MENLIKLHIPVGSGNLIPTSKVVHLENSIKADKSLSQPFSTVSSKLVSFHTYIYIYVSTYTAACLWSICNYY
jgi:hypothetical protein